MARSVSLLRELRVVGAAVTAARLLVDVVRNRAAGNDQDKRLALEGAAAVLDLVAQRATDLDRLISGSIDPSEFWAPHNDAGGAETPAAGEVEGDLVLHAWHRARGRMRG